MTASPSTTRALRERVDLAIETFLSEQRVVFAGADPAAVALVDELGRIVRAGGKRLRPLFCYWGYRAAGADDSSPIASSAIAAARSVA